MAFHDNVQMDKASIVGDAVLYVQELQMQAKKLKAEVEGLEASLSGSETCHGSNKNPKKIQIASNNPLTPKKIMLQVHLIENISLPCLFIYLSKKEKKLMS